MKILVLGINHAGTSAIRTLLELDKDKKHEVVAYDKHDSISFLGCGIALSVSGVVKNPGDLFYCNPKTLESMGAKVKMGYEVISIDTLAKKVNLKNIVTNEEIVETYEKLIFACGSQPILSDAKNRNLDKVIVCKTYNHALELIKESNDKNIKNIAIIGAGYIGIELAEAFIKKGKNVHLIDFKDRVLANNTDIEIASVIHDELVTNGVKIHLNQKVVEYFDVDKKLIGLDTNKEHIDIDLVIESIGIKPNTSIINDVDKLRNGSIKVDNKCLSSNKDIYVLGDAAAIICAASGKHHNIALATNAVKTGIVAACDIMNLSAVSLDSISGTNALCVFNKKIAGTGLTFEQAVNAGLKVGEGFYEDNDLPEWMETAEKVSIKIIYELDTMRLVGAQILSYNGNNHSEWILALSIAIQQKMNLFQIATSDVYFLPHLNKPFNFVLSAILSILGFKYFEKK